MREHGRVLQRWVLRCRLISFLPTPSLASLLSPLPLLPFPTLHHPSPSPVIPCMPSPTHAINRHQQRLAGGRVAGLHAGPPRTPRLVRLIRRPQSSGGRRPPDPHRERAFNLPLLYTVFASCLLRGGGGEVLKGCTRMQQPAGFQPISADSLARPFFQDLGRLS